MLGHDQQGGSLVARRRFDLTDRLEEATASPRFLVLALLLYVTACLPSIAAFNYPLEIESLEGINYIQAYARSQGFDIYDATRFAYPGGNHGPADHLLKAFLWQFTPYLDSFQKNRLMVLAMPFLVLWASWLWVRPHRAWPSTRINTWSRSLLIAATAIWAYYMLGARMMLVGRSDADEICLMAVLIGIDSLPFMRRHPGIAFALSAILSGCMIFANSRYIPAAGYFSVFRAARSTGYLSLGANCVKSALSYLAVWAGMWLAGVWLLFNGNVHRYYINFIGLFFDKDGYEHVGLKSFTELMAEVLPDPLWVLLALGIIALAYDAFIRTRRNSAMGLNAQASITLIIVAFVWFARFYYSNFNGVGHNNHYYFCPALILVVAHLSRFVSRERLPVVSLCLVVLFAGSLTFGFFDVLHLTYTSIARRPEASAFLSLVRTVDRVEPVYSEEMHFYHDEGPPPIVDVGVLAERLAATNYFGNDFRKTYLDHAQSLSANPPGAILFTGTYGASESVKRLIETKGYVSVAHVDPLRRYTVNLLIRPDLIEKLSPLLTENSR